jgi:hypothetical protein
MFVTVAALAVICVLSGLRAEAQAVITIDENGNGIGTLGRGVLAPDPGPGGLPSVLTYGLPFAGVQGDIGFTAAEGVFDFVRFNGNGTVVFYSDNVPTADSLGDTPGPPLGFYENLIFIPEVGPEGNNGAIYTPTAGQPGYDPSGPTYHFISDGTAARLYDPNEPGSVLVFPKFVRGTVAAGVPATEIEISVHCPIGLQPCAVPGTSVRLMGHWVCPGQLETQICKENNFIFSTTVEGTVSFNTEGSTPPTNFATVKVPAPLCPEGYLIVWAVDTRNRPIKFDGLVGDAIVRWNSHAAGSYKALAIQADPALPNNALLLTSNAGNGLVFDGGPGHYAAVTGTVMGAIKYDTLTPAADAPVTTTLTLLTLDTLSNRPNNQVFTDIDFYDANENILSEATNYVCWSETALSTIDANLTRDFMSRKGFFVSLDATKVPEEGIVDTVGAVTQIGLIDTQECPGSAACSENVPVTAGNNPTVVNHYAYRTDDDSIPVPTTFTGP